MQVTHNAKMGGIKDGGLPIIVHSDNNLAICHSYLEDHTNAKRALEDAISIRTDISTKDWVLATLNDTYNPLSVYEVVY